MESRRRLLECVPRATEILGMAEGLACAYLFGSVLDDSREQVRDVDIAVLFDRPLSFDRMGALYVEIARAFATDSVDVVDLATTRQGLRFEILSKGRLLVERDRTLHAGLRERTLREHLAIRYQTRRYYDLLAREFYESYTHAAR